ncbi:hypothetical protein BC829DRAFT_297737 [Chytridium lagenaria]|nr:hypothetical protein BC829DRAFT_297737 [Chytridium lagenaria]
MLQTLPQYILSLAGLTRACSIDVTDEANRLAKAVSFSSATCICKPIPIALLHINKVLHRDAISVLYGSNLFTIKNWTSDRKWIEGLPSSSLKHINRLLVDFGTIDDLEPDGPFVKNVEAFGDFVSTHLQCANLHLTLKCELSSVPDPEPFTRILKSRISHLKSISISLSQRPNINLSMSLKEKQSKFFRSIAKEFVNHYINEKQRPGVFPLLDLPSHVRQKIFFLYRSGFKKRKGGPWYRVKEWRHDTSVSSQHIRLLCRMHPICRVNVQIQMGETCSTSNMLLLVRILICNRMLLFNHMQMPKVFSVRSIPRIS